MKPEVLLELLEAAAEQLQIRVSYEPLQTTVVHGGLCRVKGEYRIIVDKRASAEERVTTLATAIAKVIATAKLDSATLDKLTSSAKLREVLRMHGPAPAKPAGTVAGGRTAA
jgi:hypothetical protein